MSQNVVPLKAGGPVLGIVPTNIEEAFRLAGGIAQSGLAPQGMDKPEQVLVAVMTGMELGLPPMFAVQKIAVINGRPCLWGDAIPALLYARGFKLTERIEGEGESRVAVCEVARPTGEKIERRFSVADAKRAGLWQTESRVTRKSRDGGTYQKDNDSPWYRYPDRMLQMRARGFAARDGAADVLGGLYLREEVEEASLRDVTPPEVEVFALELPDIPDVETDQSSDPDSALADAAGFLVELKEQRQWCESESDVAELRTGMADLIERLSQDDQARAEAILSGEDE